MTNTNQLIEEFDDLLYNEEINYIDKRDRRLIENFIQNLLSKTEQECDKKWVDRIIRLKEEQKSVAPADEIEKIDERAYCAALDDLLNNK